MAEIIGIKLDDSAGIQYNEQDRSRAQVLTDIYTVTAASAEEAKFVGGVPRIGNPHSLNSAAKCVSRFARGRTEVSGIYDIDVNYSTITSAEEDEEEGAVDPWDLEPEWWWDSEMMRVRVTHDAVTNQPIDNSADDPYELEWDRPIPILHVDRYQLTFDPDVILDYVSKVNSASFWGAPVASALMSAIRPRREAVQGEKIWRVHYEIKFKIDGAFGWLARVLDEGFTYLEAGARRRPQDELGNPLRVNLNGTGGILAVGGVKTYHTFDLTTRVDFNQLQLGPF